MKSPVKISHFLLLVGMMVVIASLAAMRPPAAGGDNIPPSSGPGDGTPLEDKALALLSAAMADHAKDEYPLPQGTEVASVIIEGDKVTINLNNTLVPLNSFANKIIRNTIVGMVSPLKGVAAINRMKIRINR